MSEERERKTREELSTVYVPPVLSLKGRERQRELFCSPFALVKSAAQNLAAFTVTPAAAAAAIGENVFSALSREKGEREKELSYIVSLLQ
jgi:hypothetical protein